MNASVYILLYKDDNKLVLQLRSAQDTSYPLHYDFSAAGGIEEGETHEQAAYRELKEELGVEVALTYIGEDTYKGEQMFMYKGVTPAEYTIGEEVEAVYCASEEEIRDMIEVGEKFHPEFIYWLHKS